MTGAGDRTFTGTLTAPRNARLALQDGASLEGTIPGRLNDDSENWRLQARGDDVDGKLLEFRPIIGEPTTPAPDAVMKLSFGDGIGWAPYAAVTPVQIDGASSRGTDLKYFLEFGDGFVTSTDEAAHVVDEPNYPPLTAQLTVVDRFGRRDSESASYYVYELGVNSPSEDYWLGDGMLIVFLRRTGVTY